MTSPNVTSPCSRLNDDVLREIFIYCAYDHETHAECFVSGGPRHSIRELPQISVSHVCSSWRYVALLTPQLWNNVTIKCFAESDLSIAREYLARAEKVPIAMTLDPFRVEAGRSELTDFLSSYRLQTLIISEKIPRFHLVLRDLPQRSVADLESLSIANRHDPKRASIDLNDSRYPKLSSISIWGAYRVWGSNNSLRIFDGTELSMTVIESWTLLCRCPSLEELRLRIMSDDGTIGQLHKPRIYHQCLRRLILEPGTEEGEIPFSLFIAALALPSIEKMHVVHARIAWSVVEFHLLAKRSNYFPNLTNFVLNYSNADIDIGTLLASMPSVTSVSLKCSYPFNVVFDCFALNYLASGSLAPRLQYLLVDSVSNEGEFMDMVEARVKNAQMSSSAVPVPFTEIVLLVRPHLDHDIARLSHMRRRGIPIYVEWI